jgi:predicted transcriptional regulator
MGVNILISLEPRHAKNILSGEKSIELRRRAPKVPPGTVIWMYSKKPEASIVGVVTVLAIHEASPSALWRRFKENVGVTRGEFFDYFESRDIGAAIQLGSAKRLKKPLSLEELKERDELFHPPQFFKRLCLKEPLGQAMAGAR